MRAGLGVALVGLVVCVGCEPSKQEKAIAAIKALGHYAKKFTMDSDGRKPGALTVTLKGDQFKWTG